MTAHTLARRLRVLPFVAACLLAGPSFGAPDAKAPVVTPAAEEKPASTLPGGASSLQETYDDWVVACVQQGSVKKCSQAQVQTNTQSHQRVLSLEIAPAGDKAEGLLILPFGLNLDKGVTLLVNDETSGPVLRFRTCLILGCVVPVSIDAAILAKLKKGTALKLKSEPADGGPEAVFSVSLKGFEAALDRTTALMK